METSSSSVRAGLGLIRHFESFTDHAYPDPATGAEPWTMGWGFTSGVKRGDTITRAAADARLLTEYDETERRVLALVHHPLNQNQLGALVCLTWNIGIGNLASSTLLRLVNAGDFGEVGPQFLRWYHAAGKVMAGLTVRRAAEAALFARPV